jgi:hypothetical protein
MSGSSRAPLDAPGRTHRQSMPCKFAVKQANIRMRVCSASSCCSYHVSAPQSMALYYLAKELARDVFLRLGQRRVFTFATSHTHTHTLPLPVGGRARQTTQRRAQWLPLKEGALPTSLPCGLAKAMPGEPLSGFARRVARSARKKQCALPCCGRQARGTTATVRQSSDNCSTKDVRQSTLNWCVV